VGHLAHTDTRQAELAEVTAGTTVVSVTVADTNWGSITWLPVQFELGFETLLIGNIGVLNDCLELLAPLRIACDDFLALLILGDLGLLSHRLSLLAEFDVLTDYGIVLLQGNTIRIIALILPGDIGVTGASGRLQLDDWTNVIACHL
jgi:hypothetical protein